MRCTHCDSRLTKKNKFCPECGTVVLWEKSDRYREDCRSKIIIMVLAILLIVAVVIIGALFLSGNGATEKSSNEGETTQVVVGFCDDPSAISNAANSVVKINCYNSKGELIGSGSGFSAFDKGVIVTNYHVIADRPVRVEIVMESGEKCDVIGGVGISIERDVAILYYDARNSNFTLPVLPVNSSNLLQKGEKVVAIGSPLGLTNVVSTGIFSGYANIGDVTDIQFTASISSGSSGGALFNNSGEVIGITYASITEGQNLNFAVPMEFVESLWREEWKDRAPFESFYDTLIPHYTVDYVLENYRNLVDTEFYLDFWASSYGETTDGVVGFCASSYSEIYDPTQNVPETRFQADMERYSNSSLLRVVCYERNYWSERMISFLFKKRGEINSIKCTGAAWSQDDKKPFVIYEG